MRTDGGRGSKCRSQTRQTLTTGTGFWGVVIWEPSPVPVGTRAHNPRGFRNPLYSLSKHHLPKISSHCHTVLTTPDKTPTQANSRPLPPPAHPSPSLLTYHPNNPPSPTPSSLGKREHESTPNRRASHRTYYGYGRTAYGLYTGCSTSHPYRIT